MGGFHAGQGKPHFLKKAFGKEPGLIRLPVIGLREYFLPLE
jgi:hypothetical protein